MDRLEKALEKSRQQRATMDQPAATTRQAPPYKPDDYAVPHTDAAQVNELHMERNRIVAHRNRDAQADVYRQLRTQILQIMNKSGYRTLAVTSPHYNDGKSTVALNLGISISLDIKQTVLLVDLDLRKPSLDHYLGAKPQVGLTDYLLNDCPISDCIMRPPFERVSILPAGSSLDNSSEFLGSPKMAALAQELKDRYPDRLVIYDMPPVLAQDDSIAFLPHVDAVLVVIRDGMTRAEDIKRCLSILSGANVIGTVLNNSY